MKIRRRAAVDAKRSMTSSLVGQMTFSCIFYLEKQSAVNELLRKAYTSFTFFALARLGAGLGPAAPL